MAKPTNLKEEHFAKGEQSFRTFNYKQALIHFQKALDLYEDKKEEASKAECLDRIGQCYIKLLDFQEALDHCQQALDLRRKVFGRNHAEIVKSLNSLGDCYLSSYKLKQALKHYEQAIEMSSSSSSKLDAKGKNDELELAARSQGSAALVYEKMGEFKKSLDLNLKSMQIYEKIYLNEDNSNLATILNRMGNCYAWLNQDLEKSLEYNMKAFKMRQRLLNKSSSSSGDQHPHLAHSWHGLAITYRRIKDYERALECDLKGLQIRESLYKSQKDHSDLA
jgi:predicted negative regulator of RcsB-dependent stress response